MRKRVVLIAGVIILLMVASTFAVAPVSEIQSAAGPESPLTLNYSTFINANSVLMFVSNAGSFGYNRDRVFGSAEGAFYPYVSLGLLETGELTKAVQYAGGVWL